MNTGAAVWLAGLWCNASWPARQQVAAAAAARAAAFGAASVGWLGAKRLPLAPCLIQGDRRRRLIDKQASTGLSVCVLFMNDYHLCIGSVWSESKGARKLDR